MRSFDPGHSEVHGFPYDVVGKPRVRTLIPSDFVAANQILNVISNVAELEVSRGHAMVLKNGTPFQAFLHAAYELAITPDVATTLAVDLGAQGFKLAQSTRTSPALPTAAHLDVSFDISTDGGTTWTETNVTAIDWVANIVTGVKTAGTNRVRVRYLPGDGEIQLAAIVPMASDGSQAVIHSKPLRGLFEADQSNIRTGTRLELHRDIFLPPEWVLAIRVRSKSKILWTDAAENILALPVIDVPISLRDKVKLWRMSESELKGLNY